MSAKPKKTPLYDVFLSYSKHDTDAAHVIAKRMRDADVEVFTQPTSANAARFEDAIREALAESRVVVAVISPRSIKSTTLAMEIGAAQAWQKAIFLVLNHVQPAALPPYLREQEAIAINQLHELVTHVKASAAQLSDSQLRVLREIYQDTGIPSDQLARRPIALERFAKMFNARAHASFSPERVLQELIRLRKGGGLRRGRRGVIAFVEPRPAGRPEGSAITHYVLENKHAARVTGKNYATQADAIAAAKKLGHKPLVARVRNTVKGNPDHWRDA